jgi:hypothetical protein
MILMEPTVGVSTQESQPSDGSQFIPSPLMQKLRVDKQSAFLFRRRRQPDWTDNYTLGRDKVQINRLTQRQSVNIPLIKSTVKTLLKDVDEPPILYFRNHDNNDQAEVYYNEYWHYNSIQNKLVLKDIVDKRQEMYFGRTFKFMNIVDGQFFWEIVDPQDVLVDRYVDPTDIDTARFVIREHIYTPLSSLMTSSKYDNRAVRKLQKFLGSTAGLVRATENQLDWVEKQRRMATLGVIDTFAPQLGETYVELNEFWIKEFNKDTKQDEINYIVTAEDMFVLYQAPLEQCIGETKDHFWQSHYPVNTWADETERTDFWSDGVVDSIRTINKILNAFLSQKIENRTLKSFGMNYFNSSLGEEGFTPQTFEPVPWGWYPVPAGANGKLADMIMNVPVPDLNDVFKDIDFLMTLAQQASAATSAQQGVVEQSPVTLGEVQLTLNNAQQRVKAMSKYYNAAWEDFGLKFVKMLEAADDMIEPITINKKGRLTDKNYTKTISPKDWFAKNGYGVECKMKEDVQTANLDSLQKLQFSKTLMPMNNALNKVIKKKSLELADVPAGEMAEILKEDEMQTQALINAPPNPAMAGTPPGGAPQTPPTTPTAPVVQPAPMM